jgi:PAS domain S-box-containing protein
MANRIVSLIDEIKKMDIPDDQSGRLSFIIDELKKINSEFDKTTFKYERSGKDKNILSSLLTRTSIDLKKVSENLKTRAEELSTMLTTIPAYVYFKDSDLRYVMVNQPFAELIGATAESIKGKQLQDIIPGYNNADYIVNEKRVLETGIPLYNIEEEIIHQDRKRWVSSNLAPIRNSLNEIAGLIGISWDITERKLHEEELHEAKEEAEAGTLAKNEFIASVSHEFRTPMNGILGLADIMRNSPLSDEQSDLLKGITTSAQNLLVLLNDVLDFSAIEAGKMTMDYQPFLLDRVMEDISLMIKMKADEKSLRFNIITDKNVPNHLIGDSNRLRQILINLTNNSVKFTESGKIDVCISVVEHSEDKATLRFEVRDTGMGIPEKAINSLFRVFSRVKQDKTKLIAGTGLGLSICKKLIDMMNGQIGVESTEGKGSTFWFVIPLSLTTLPKKVVVQDEPAGMVLYHGKRVLVAEDNLINQRIVSFQLKKLGFEIDLASDGQEAYEKYSSEQNYDLIILDIQMPKMDGYEVAKAIRQMERNFASHSPIIALTANAMKGDRELYLEAGMDGYVSKPFTLETLQEAIAKLLK